MSTPTITELITAEMTESDRLVERTFRPVVGSMPEPETITPEGDCPGMIEGPHEIFTPWHGEYDECSECGGVVA